MKKKLFIFSMTHALPTAMALTEDGDIIAQHGGEDAGDATGWLLYHHPNLEKDYEVIIMDQKLIEKNMYHGAPLSIFPDDFVAAFKKNQVKAAKAQQRELS